MRRSRVAVGGVVCALLLGGGVSTGCRSREEQVAQMAKQSEVPPAKKQEVKEKADMRAAPSSPESPPPESATKSDEAQAMKLAPAPSGVAKHLFAGKSSGLGDLMGAGKGASSGPGIGGLGVKGSGKGGGGTAYGSGSATFSGRGAMAGKKMVVMGAPLSRAAPVADPVANTEGYQDAGINPFVSAAEDKLSTFAIDVDTGAYTLARRKIHEGSLPAQEGVRVEEFLNYFRYSYPGPTDGSPLAVHMDAAPSPYTQGRHLLRVGVQGKQLSISERKSAHLTFLVDVSGSMSSPDRLPLAKRALRMLVDNLRDGDTVSLVTYAGHVKLALPPTGMEKKALIHAAIAELEAGGSTAMASGIDVAYAQAMKTLDDQSLSRVIILSDGDANVGATSHEEILKQIRGYVKEGITVTTVGFGMGNYKDSTMEQFANQGNGNHYYVDSLMAARRIFQEQLGGTLEVIAQDVKLQVEFDPAQVARYRLVGYENRAIADIHFRDDKVDAGELGSGHSVTALYELELKPGAGEALATVRVRAKKPRGEKATERAFAFSAQALAPTFSMAKEDLRFATAVMGAAELFRRSPHAQRWNFDQVKKIAREATPAGNAEREEFLQLLDKASPLVGRVAAR
ncbi:vWA domain-containing protein [Hyalangium rubrum]|uniref:von Willebrand factor type A domain-containing protein n=1 Tax=Hyalangium rubrum TaxID=3103134 RepID=A0ABU5HDE8_9BACT|nr:von Willebrand factor type A domain-containing protein [Hyalangium sp. s54d21]MDY7231371.1 von Willebrand factor type A domain-containing protein [Hyalangium sp. s54d21]